MATLYDDQVRSAAHMPPMSLADPARSIIGPWRDALLIWGAPSIAFLLVELWVGGWAALAPAPAAQAAVGGLFGVIGVLTFAHLIAVVPRAYLNADVFGTHRARLTIVPLALIVALLVSPTALLLASIAAVLWDVHHSAMQNFGFARLYDVKAGNPPAVLRAADLRLNWAMYVGPLIAGAAMTRHFDKFPRLDGTAFAALTSVPGTLDAHHGGLRTIAVAAYAIILLWTFVDYARAMRGGYRLPAHKLATLAVTGIVSILAWGFSPPLIALAAVNLYHAVQYFALVWIKEGGRMTRPGLRPHQAAVMFGGLCLLFGAAYAAVAAEKPSWLLAPFVACSLLHFWYDGFVWSVRRRQM